MNSDDVYAFRAKELTGHALLALTFLAALLMVQAALPVVHVHLVAPGGPFAAAGAAGFGVASCLMLRLALQDIGAERRALFALAGAGAAVIGVAQIGFGDRLLGEAAGGSIRVVSSHGEADAAGRLPVPGTSSVHRLATQVIVGWTLVSSLLLLGRRRMAGHVLASGVPFFAWRIMPFALPPVLLFSTNLVTHPDEIGRLALALLVAIWSIDLYRQTALRPGDRIERLIRQRAGLIAATIVAVLTLVNGLPRDLPAELNRAAAYSYPVLGMDRQARELFSYILERPQHIDESTFPNLRALYPDLAHRMVRGRLQTAGPEQQAVGRPERTRLMRQLLDLAT